MDGQASAAAAAASATCSSNSNNTAAAAATTTAPRRRGPRKPRRRAESVNSEQDEAVCPPKVLINKRPPRRPRGAAPREKCDASSFARSFNDAIECNSDNLSETDRLLRETERKIALLKLRHDSSAQENSESTPSTSDQSSGLRIRKRTRRHRNRGKLIADETNVLPEDADDVSPKASACYFNDNQKHDKRKEEKQKLYINNRVRSKPRRPQTSEADEEASCSKDKDKRDSSDKYKNHKKKDKKKKERRLFCDHLPIDVVKKLLGVQDPENPNIVEGSIRINPRCYQNAYVASTNGEPDILIVGLKDRNRALEGDNVAVVIHPQDKWFKVDENTFHKTGAVVSILEKFHPRKAVGFLKKQDVFVFLQPRDYRVPLMKIRPKTVPKAFYDNPDLFKETLFLCNIVDWKKTAFAEGEIQLNLGPKGDLDVESNAILLENDLVLKPFNEEQTKDLPPADYVPSESDIAGREDMRNKCIFTIDPATAVDLDDALSCEPLENGNFEIGVHIADVTHFLEAFSPLDKAVAERANTIYMVDNVYHMLPKQLCLACSLLPGQDKLAFSVIMEITPSGEVVKSRFAKIVMNSCCQMSYEQAQKMIDDDDFTYDWEKDGSLKIVGGYTAKDLWTNVKNLYSVAVVLRNKRYEDGALRIDQPKLHVFIDKETRMPINYAIENRRESNSLIEEYMLLANMVVAKHLYETMPEVSLLRSHPEPCMRVLQKTKKLLEKFGVLLNIESAGALHESLLMYQSFDEYDPSSPEHGRMMVINCLCAKSMTRALYKCSATVETKDDLRHYALNAEFYTHFTSPIRRYPDCVVHRLLYSSITDTPMHSEWNSELCRKIASNCNGKKFSAKQAQEQSNALYFTYWLELRGSIEALAIVMEVKERSADAMLCDTGLKVRLYFNDTVEETTSEYTMEHDVPTVRITWTERKIVQVINIFSILHVKITKHQQLFRLQGVILPPLNANASQPAIE
ncbi:DIS3-like exonuclease 2 [Trichogramma pretiosum]|uniref:DIS3-like exonuclease 2 n=1 Tax=Trichogramma pretiosum TaxID=7493 RepID=UPI0006C974C0|nr:DIS3-like exonuclease 2 [Trichogramma pretiosum]XP_014238071.1 DIS3-like exonuclease 2 [Trichogramma pretiosum]